MNMQMTEQQEALLERARAVDWCESSWIILRGSFSVRSENQWRAVLAYATPSELELLAGHVQAEEMQWNRGRASRDAFDADREAREAPLSEMEQAALNQQLIEDTVRAQDAQRPATRAQLDTMISLQRDVLDELRKRR